MDRQTEIPSPRDPETNVTIQNRTSFLIEDILYRQKSNPDECDKIYETREIQNLAPFKSSHHAKAENAKAFVMPNKVLEKRQDKGAYSYFQSNMVQGGVFRAFSSRRVGIYKLWGRLGRIWEPL